MNKYAVYGEDLASVANSIRIKGNTSASLAFPSGFISAINAIPTGGGGTNFKDVAERTITSVDDSTITKVGYYAFADCYNLSTVSIPNCTVISQYAFSSCSSLTSCSGSDSFLLADRFFPILLLILVRTEAS